ncbi:hypothetical protein OIU78_006984 [Salix suchowensis]|nr:hypothetical protein OIU78_006984 [Salix suchowensis]
MDDPNMSHPPIAYGCGTKFYFYFHQGKMALCFVSVRRAQKWFPKHPLASIRATLGFLGFQGFTGFEVWDTTDQLR